MALFKASNIAESCAITEVYVTDIGMVELVEPCLKITGCSQGEIGEKRLLIPQVVVVWPLCRVWHAMRIMESALLDGMAPAAMTEPVMRRH